MNVLKKRGRNRKLKNKNTEKGEIKNRLKTDMKIKKRRSR
jgi:hypothetical protein